MLLPPSVGANVHPSLIGPWDLAALIKEKWSDADGVTWIDYGPMSHGNGSATVAREADLVVLVRSKMREVDRDARGELQMLGVVPFVVVVNESVSEEWWGDYGAPPAAPLPASVRRQRDREWRRRIRER